MKEGCSQDTLFWSLFAVVILIVFFSFFFLVACLLVGWVYLYGGDVVSGIGEQEGVAPEAGVEDGLCPQRSAHSGCLLSPQACHRTALKHSSSKHCFSPQKNRAFAPINAPPLSATLTLVTGGSLWRVSSWSSGALTPPMNTYGDSQASSLTVFFNVLWRSPPNAEHGLSGSGLSCLLSGLFNSFSSVPPGSSDPIGCYWYPFWTTQDGKPVYTLEIRWRSRILWTSWNFRKNWCVCVCVYR